MRQRSLLVVKQVEGNNGLEAYRLLISQNEPANKNRSMSLLNTIMNWPVFNSKVSLLQNVLRLEHAFSEYERLGTAIQDDLKTAILLRSVYRSAQGLVTTSSWWYNRLHACQGHDHDLWRFNGEVVWDYGSWCWQYSQFLEMVRCPWRLTE